MTQLSAGPRAAGPAGPAGEVLDRARSRGPAGTPHYDYERFSQLAGPVVDAPPGPYRVQYRSERS